MSSFDERERGFERKFERDQELAFKIRARRDRLFGLWAAERLGLTGDVAEAYGRGLAEADAPKHDDDKLVAKVAGDFAAKKVGIDDVRVRVELQRFAAEAKRQLGSPR